MWYAKLMIIPTEEIHLKFLKNFGFEGCELNSWCCASVREAQVVLEENMSFFLSRLHFIFRGDDVIDKFRVEFEYKEGQ